MRYPMPPESGCATDCYCHVCCAADRLGHNPGGHSPAYACKTLGQRTSTVSEATRALSCIGSQGHAPYRLAGCCIDAVLLSQFCWALEPPQSVVLRRCGRLIGAGACRRYSLQIVAELVDLRFCRQFSAPTQPDRPTGWLEAGCPDRSGPRPRRSPCLCVVSTRGASQVP